MKKCIPKFQEREGNEKNLFPKFGNGKGMKKGHSQNSEREGNEKNIPKIREWESEAIIPKNGCEEEQEWNEKKFND